MRILLADDHAVVRRLIRSLLQSEDDFIVCGEAATGREAVELAASEHPDVIVLDLSMPELNGLQAAALIHEKSPEIAIIVLSLHAPFELTDQLAAVGVQRCLLKTEFEELVGAIRDVGSQRTVPASDKVHARC